MVTNGKQIGLVGWAEAALLTYNTVELSDVPVQVPPSLYLNR